MQLILYGFEEWGRQGIEGNMQQGDRHLNPTLEHEWTSVETLKIFKGINIFFMGHVRRYCLPKELRQS